jgi:hypothetical protein
MINDPTEEPPANHKSDWKPTLVTNPEYLRLQSLRRPNPAYRGRWQPPKVRNPDYRGESVDGKFLEDIGVVGVYTKTQIEGILIDDIELELFEAMSLINN